jgi:hypothetical protein
VSAREERQQRAFHDLKRRVIDQERKLGKKVDERSVDRMLQQDVRKVEVDHSKAWNK